MRQLVVLFLLSGLLLSSPGCTMLMWERVMSGPTRETAPSPPTPAEMHWDLVNQGGRSNPRAPVGAREQPPERGTTRLARYVVAVGLSPFTLALDALLIPFFIAALPNM